MKKKLLLLLIFTLLLTVALISCGDNKTYHSVKFDPDNSEKIVYQKFEYGSLITEPEAPTREGFVFKGWYFNGVIWNFETDKLTTDVVLTAKWARILCTVNFDSDGGDAIEEKTVGYGDLVPKPQDPTKNGYKFLGWYNGDVEWDFTTSTVKESITLKAKWEKHPTYTITFDSQGGSEVAPKYVILNAKIPMPPSPELVGYAFVEWLYNGAAWNFDTDVVTSDMTLVAVWYKLPIFTVSFNTDGGGDIPAQEILSGNKLAAITPPVKDGYKLDGWVDEEGNEVNLDTYIPIRNTTLTAVWLPLSSYKFNVTFNAMNNSSLTTVQVTGGSLIERPANPTHFDDNKEFSGWYIDDGDLDNTNDVLWNFEQDTVKGDVTLKAKWINKQFVYYKVTFDFDNGDEAVIREIRGSSYITNSYIPETPEKEGYAFDGWYNGNKKWEFMSDTVKEDTILRAKWTRVYTVTFNPDNSTELITQIIRDGECATAPTAPTKQNYRFDGWYDINGDTAWTFETPITKDTNLKAKWIEVVTYTVTFDADGGSAVDTQYVPEDTRINFDIVITTKDKYIFDGWYNGNVKWNPYDKVTENITLKAKWRDPHIFTVTFITGDDATQIAPITVVEGQKISLPEPPTSTNKNKVFDCWKVIKTDSLGVEYEDDIDFGTFIVTDNVKLVAEWRVSTPIVPF